MVILPLCSEDSRVLRSRRALQSIEAAMGDAALSRRRAPKSAATAALLERVADARASRANVASTEAADPFWPSIAENDARLFDDSEEGPSCNPGNSSASDALSVEAEGKPKPSGRRRLRKVGEAISASHEDDPLVRQLEDLSLGRSSNKAPASSKVVDSSGFGSAASSFASEDESVQILEDDGSSESDSVCSVEVPVKRSQKPPEKPAEKSECLILEDGAAKFVLSSKISTMLYQHQREGIRWLWGLHCRKMGGILGDDMGLGKTMQVAAFLSGLFDSRLIKRALVVAPKTLIAHWEKELTVAGLQRKVRDYSGTSVSTREHNLLHVLQTGGVLLTTYDIVRNNCKALCGDLHGRDGFGDLSDELVTWDYLFLDEGHLIKNPSTQRAKSLKEIPSAHRVIISGTPIQNNLREMWALYDFCSPGLLGDHKEFKAKYENLILSGNDKHATDREKRIGSAVAQELRDKIAPFLLRRLKSEVFPNTGNTTSQQLSKKNDIIVWLRLSTRQRQMYTAFLSSQTAHQSLEGSALAALTVLKKICDHPLLLTKRATDDVVEGMESMNSAAAEAMRASLQGLIDPDGDDDMHNEDSCKIVFLLALLDNLMQEGHRTLVFAQTLKMLDIVQEELLKRKYRFCRIDGKAKCSDRQRLVEEFQRDDRISIFLLTSQVGGLGLTLTGADRVVIVDPAWNPSRDNQSVDRAYRIGQAKDVIIYRLMTCGTLEEKIYRKQVFKGGLMKVATEHKDQFRYFSQQDLRELLTVPKTGFDVSPTQQQLYAEHANQFQVDEKLAEHIKFLESQGIAGVSHHDLLFSKAAPELPPASADEVASAWDAKLFGGSLSRAASYGKTVAERPGDPKLAQPPRREHWKGVDRANLVELQDNDVNRRNMQENLTRLTAMLSNPGLMSKLADGGENIRSRIRELKSQLSKLPDVIDIDPSPTERQQQKQQQVDLDSISSVFNKLRVEE